MKRQAHGGNRYPQRYPTGIGGSIAAVHSPPSLNRQVVGEEVLNPGHRTPQAPPVVAGPGLTLAVLRASLLTLSEWVRRAAGDTVVSGRDVTGLLLPLPVCAQHAPAFARRTDLRSPSSDVTAKCDSRRRDISTHRLPVRPPSLHTSFSRIVLHPLCRDADDMTDSRTALPA